MAKRYFTKEQQIKRFWSRVLKRGPDECWPWMGARRSLIGHGQIRFRKRTMTVTRFLWEILNGPIPNGLYVCHKCDYPPCVNPAHLFLGDQFINMRDASAKGRMNKGIERYNAKLTDDAVQDIRKSPLTQIALAKIYGVHQSIITEVISRKRWKHVT